MEQQPETMPVGESSAKMIVLVEDHPLFGMIMKRAIEDHTPYTVVHITEGSQLLETLHEHHPHLLMLDYELPGQNGIELYDLVHTTPGWEQLPALIVSADPPRDALVQRKLRSVTKPCHSLELVRAVESVLTEANC